jgi:hypothetical protein
MTAVLPVVHCEENERYRVGPEEHPENTPARVRDTRPVRVPN